MPPPSSDPTSNFLPLSGLRYWPRFVKLLSASWLSILYFRRKAASWALEFFLHFILILRYAPSFPRAPSRIKLSVFSLDCACLMFNSRKLIFRSDCSATRLPPNYWETVHHQLSEWSCFEHHPRTWGQDWLFYSWLFVFCGSSCSTHLRTVFSFCTLSRFFESLLRICLKMLIHLAFQLSWYIFQKDSSFFVHFNIFYPFSYFWSVAIHATEPELTFPVFYNFFLPQTPLLILQSTMVGVSALSTSFKLTIFSES